MTFINIFKYGITKIRFRNRRPGIRIIGTTSSLGNNDGKTSTQISFLGIEDFYGGKSEFMGGIGFYGEDIYIYDGFNPYKPPTVDYRVVYSGMYKESGGIYKVVWGGAWRYDS